MMEKFREFMFGQSPSKELEEAIEEHRDALRETKVRTTKDVAISQSVKRDIDQCLKIVGHSMSMRRKFK